MTTTTDPLYKRVQFTAGQEVRAGDLNNVSTFLAARLSDQILGSMIGGLSITGNPNHRTTGLTVTVSVSGSVATYTRTVGDFTAEGFAVGQIVVWAGFANQGNNTFGLIRVGLSATVMTMHFVAGTQVNESGPVAGATVSQAVVDPGFAGSDGVDPPTHLAYCLHGGSAHLRQGAATNQLEISPGVLMQKIAAANGNDAQLLAYTFQGTEQVSITAGDVVHPRVDLMQMQLSLVNADSESRVTESSAQPAMLSMASVTVDIDTIIRAKIWGLNGDNISINIVAGSLTGIIWSEAGSVITVQFQSGVSTVAQFEAALTANSNLVEIASTGTGTRVLVTPGDLLANAHLSGGADNVFAGSTPNMQKIVQCVLSVKSGTPATSPITPDPDAGCVAIASVVVGTSYLITSALIFGLDTGGATAVVMDQRMPLNVQTYLVHPNQMVTKSTGDWALTVAATTDGFNEQSYAASTGTQRLFVPCPKTGSGERIVGLAIYGGNLSQIQMDGLDTNENGIVNNTLSPNYPINVPYYYFETNHTPLFGPTVLPSPVNFIGVPLWANGLRCAGRGQNPTAPGRRGVNLWITGGSATVQGIDFLVAQGL
jgi:hypothetical protein